MRDTYVTSQVSVCNVCTKKRDNVAPKLVESGDTGRCLCSHPKGTCHNLSRGRVSADGSVSRVCNSRVLDEVGVHDSCAIEGEALRKLNKGNSICAKVDLRWNTLESSQFLVCWRILAVVGNLGCTSALKVRSYLDIARAWNLVLQVGASC